MKLQRILSDFNATKQKIRSKTKSQAFPRGGYDGLQMAIDYSAVMENVVRGLFSLTAKEMGYGYILRIISRNPNVMQETLEMIASDSNIEPRYSQCARAALESGRDAANHQV